MRTERLLCLRNQSDLALGGKNYELVDEKLVHARPLFSDIFRGSPFFRCVRFLLALEKGLAII